MSRILEIRKKLKQWCSDGAPQPTMLGIVKSVNATKLTCVVEDDGLDYPSVRLQPVLTGSDGLTIFPVVGKWVLCSRIESENEWYLIGAEEVFKYRLKVGQTLFEINAAGVKISKSGDSLKSCMTDLFTQIQLITVPCTAPGTPSGVPINNIAFTTINNRINNLLQ